MMVEGSPESQPAPSDEEQRKSFRRLGAISLAIGILSLTRLSIELYLVRSLPSASGYVVYVAYDYLLAFAAAASGMALFRRSRPGVPLTLIVGAALFLTSALAIFQYGFAQIRMLLELRTPNSLDLWVGLGSRWLLTVIQAVYWPIASGHLYLDLQFRGPAAPETRRLKRRFWMWTGAGLLAGGALELLLRHLGPS
jgi:hypothetical protein